MTALAVVEDFGLSLRPNSLAMTAADIPLDNQSRMTSAAVWPWMAQWSLFCTVAKSRLVATAVTS